MGKHQLYDQRGKYIYTLDQATTDEMRKAQKIIEFSDGITGGSYQLVPGQPTWPWKLRSWSPYGIMVIIVIVIARALSGTS